MMRLATMTMNDEVFVLVPLREYEDLTQNAELPKMPVANPDGTFPALPAARVSIATSIIKSRREAGLTQKALAAAAGVRIETLNRIEKAKVTPDTATILKIDRALKRAKKSTESTVR